MLRRCSDRLTTPSPGDIAGEGSSEQRTNHTSKAEHSPKQPLEQRAFVQWDRVHYHGDLKQKRFSSAFLSSRQTPAAFQYLKKRKGLLTAPDIMPELPTPEIARPTMKATEFGAAPQMAEPTSKSPMVTRNVHFTL